MPSETESAVFPAHAGMSLSMSLEQAKRACFPRSRGDEPANPIIIGKADEFSPLTRG